MWWPELLARATLALWKWVQLAGWFLAGRWHRDKRAAERGVERAREATARREDLARLGGADLDERLRRSLE